MKKDIIPYIDSVENLKREFNELYQKRLIEKQSNKAHDIQRAKLSSEDRLHIYNKTEGNCHVCGCDLDLKSFEADHVVPKSQGGGDWVDNFLPACSTCNNYRWNYSPEEIQWILKLGVWLKTKMLTDHHSVQKALSEFIKDEIIRENRRKAPRVPKTDFEIDLRNLFPIKGKHNKGFIEVSIEELKEAQEIIDEYRLNEPELFNVEDYSFVLSGEGSIKRDELKAKILNSEGKIKSNISKSVDFLVLGNFYGFSKLKQVEELNAKGARIRVISIDQLISKLYKS